MRRLLVALTLVAAALVPLPAEADAGPYSSPRNLGVHHPFGAPVVLETQAIDFVAKHPFSQFTIEAHDWLGYDVWIKVCLRFAGVCYRTVEGEDSIVIEAPPGAQYPQNTVARVYVYVLHAWADGEVSVASWGGVRAQFHPEAVTYDIVPYVGSGYGGQIGSLIPINLRVECGYLLGAQCMTAPVTARNVRISVVDEVAQSTYFEACLFMPNGATIQCSPASNVANMPGIPAGGTVDVRPYTMLFSNVVGTKGYVLVQYFV